MPSAIPACGSAPHILQDTDLVIVELSYESHLSYASPVAMSTLWVLTRPPLRILITMASGYVPMGRSIHSCTTGSSPFSRSDTVDLEDSAPHSPLVMLLILRVETPFTAMSVTISACSLRW